MADEGELTEVRSRLFVDRDPVDVIQEMYAHWAVSIENSMAWLKEQDLPDTVKQELAAIFNINPLPLMRLIKDGVGYHETEPSHDVVKMVRFRELARKVIDEAKEGE